MIILLSPSKTFTNNLVESNKNNKLNDKTVNLLNIINKLSKDDLIKKMNISEKIATETFDYYQNFNNNLTAIYLYGGTAFKHFDALSIPENKLKRVYILSGLYGLLNALDPISKYRLDINDKVLDESLYNYWSNDINSKLDLLKDQTIINLASKEYSKLITNKYSNMYTINFVLEKNGKITSGSMMLKKMRGLMANHLLNNDLKCIEKIKDIKLEGFSYCNILSSENEIIFKKMEA
ncbi:YaaA family protein [Haploplasma modicum]|uniref:YaaA family protein n=1 Tax=Haploplasma modicum TaxID=2150 RepID=UPI00214C5DDC|nr:YaaA family protein [Haploplasma modicum]MCR1809216.1 YaaA family protein [Haploplasma modicum]